ncbi:MAG: ATP-grasp domain-containing protein [Nanopusillaceae archaeon]|jgi:RimK family alpha-L-glutamate ligase
MSKIAILIREKAEDYRIKRMTEEIRNFNNINMIEMNKEEIFPFEESRFLDYDTYYFFLGTTSTYDMHMLAKFLYENGKNVVNKIHVKEAIMYKAMFYYYLYKYVKIPEFAKIYSLDNIEYIIKKIGFPMVIKHQLIHRGEFVYKINSEEELYKFLEDYLINKKGNLRFLIFQKYIPYEKDIRVLFVGEPFGGMQRINEKSFKGNISQGAYGKPYELNEELKEIGYKIMEKADLQIFAYDVLIKDDEYYLIDIHNIFQYEGFEKYVGKNVTRKILEYLNEVGNKG